MLSQIPSPLSTVNLRPISLGQATKQECLAGSRYGVYTDAVSEVKVLTSLHRAGYGNCYKPQMHLARLLHNKRTCRLASGHKVRCDQFLWRSAEYFPPDDTALTIGQLAWLDNDLLLPGMVPLLMTSGKTEEEVKTLIENAHHDLYYPIVKPSTRLHVVHARKRS